MTDRQIAAMQRKIAQQSREIERLGSAVKKLTKKNRDMRATLREHDDEEPIDFRRSVTRVA